MERLTEKEMRLLVGIVLDASVVARLTRAEEDSEEMEKAIEVIALSNSIVKICNEMYPVEDDTNQSIFGIERYEEDNMEKSLSFEELESGMKVWDNKNKHWQKVLRVSLWKRILEDSPDRFYKNKI